MDDKNKYDIAIIGGGPAGLSSAIYAGRSKLRTIVFGDGWGGETALSGIIWNYPGAKNIDGYDLIKIMREQAKDFGSDFMDERVDSVSKEGDFFKLNFKNNSLFSKTIVFATGTKRKKLNILREDDLKGRGVHYCVICDGPVYSGKEIAMIGGGNSAIKGALIAINFAKKIYIINKKENLSGEQMSIDELKKYGDKIEVIHNTKVEELIGEEKLDKILLSKDFKGSRELKIDAIFVEVGTSPNNELLKEIGIETDEGGYAKVNKDMSTNIAGVFVAGDIADIFNGFKQNIVASAMGSVAANSASNFLKNLS